MFLAATPAAAKKVVDCLEATRSIVVGNGAHATVEEVPDRDLQFRAANCIIERIYGKAPQVVTGEDGEPIKLVVDIIGRLKRLGAE